MTVPSGLVPARITQLPLATSVGLSDLTLVVQNGQSKQAPLSLFPSSVVNSYPYLVATSTPALASSRTLSASGGLSVSDGGPGGTMTVSTVDLLASINALSGVGFISKTGSSTAAVRTLVSGSVGLAVANGDGATGNPTVSAAGPLASLQNLSGVGSVMSVAPGVYTLRSMTATPGQIDIDNNTGVTGDPTFRIAVDPVLPGFGGVTVPTGNSSQRPVGSGGLLRYNSELALFEYFQAGGWNTFPPTAPGVVSVGTGAGLTGGPITTSGTISVATNGITNSLFRQSAATSIVGNSTGSVANVADIVASADGGVLRRAAGVLGFGNIPVASVTNAVPDSRTITAGTGMTGGGDLTANRTLSIANTITAAGPIGSASVIPVITFNAQGQLTTVTTATITPAAIGAVASVAGTANEITASGTTAVTLSLPTALTFTGKTVTGGTFASPTLTTPALGTPASGTMTNVTGLPLTTGVTGILPLANGGSNANLTASNGGIVWSNATQMQILAGTATAGQILRSGASGAPSWSTATYPATTTINQILFSSAANTVTGLATVNTGALVTSSTGVPSFALGTTANRVLRTDGTTVSFGQVALTTDVTGILPGANGGTNSAFMQFTGATTSIKTYTVPDASVTLAALQTVQTFTVAQRGSVSALTDGATITPDFAAANNFSVTLGGNRTLANPTNQTAGQSGCIVITQDATGGRTLAYGANWDFSGGSVPVLPTAANSVSVLVYYVESASRISATLLSDMR